MKKFYFCGFLVLTGLMTSCVDKNEEVDADSKPSWLGSSIYAELMNPQGNDMLTGTFSNYLRLIDDLGYAETLNRTGSKTIFPANDSAFARFFQSNDWGVTSYEQLSTAQKKMLLYSSMLDNALLVNMFSNVSSGSESVTKGMAMKHQTNLSLIDTIQYIKSESQMPQNNPLWDKFRDEGKIYIVSDATQPVMVHFTREHMLNNGITTIGDQSDFAILTGTTYSDGMAYVFDDQIVKSDVTCQNGYIHQMKDVIVPPGNMAQVLRADKETSYFSRIIDYYSAPYPNQSLTDSYNAWAKEQGLPTIDMIYEVRYLNNQTGHKLNLDPDNNIMDYLLSYDPGWNQYYPNANATSTIDLSIADIGAMFVPTDEAMEAFFTEGGGGAYLIDLYGNNNVPNDVAHLNENLDSLRNKKPEILNKFVNNLMSASFIETVPSKFRTILSDASEDKGISLDIMHKRDDGRYDIKIANNGIIYKINKVISPDEYESVMAPSSVYPDMNVMNWAVQDDKNLKLSFHYYLMAMRAKYAFFVPDDAAFEKYYVDPVYLGHDEPRVLKFYYDEKNTVMPLRCVAYRYYPQTGEVGEVMKNGANVDLSEWKSLMTDILNYHTVVLESGEELGTNNYYRTKHGGEIRLTSVDEGGKVMSGQQIDNGVEPATITKVYGNLRNGTTFRIDHVIESPRNSVSKTLQSDSVFSEFYKVCAGFSNDKLLAWAGISNEPNELQITEQDAYIIFTTDNKNASDKKPTGNCLDENVKMFNTYHYTLYAPNNAAMKKAYETLPSWDKIQKIMTDAINEDWEGEKLESAKAEAKKMIDELRDFARYHFQSTSVYADNVVPSGNYKSLSTDNLGLALELKVRGGNGKLIVTDGSGTEHTVDANNGAMKSNLMARDYWFDDECSQASSIYTSSFCVIHEISEPLNSGLR